MSTDQLIAASQALVAVIELRNRVTNSDQIAALDSAFLRLKQLLAA